ncbi:MAG: class I SAM-dependent methyltransferase [Thermoproteota archaeon]|nr:class I SAM-dependent methyltransferase [Candidatus Brockarchaeota archaeon]
MIRDMAISRMLMDFPYLPSPIQVVDAALELAEAKANEVLVDLGSGDGTVLLRAAEKFGVFSIGFELDERLIRIAMKRIKEAGLNQMIDIVKADLFQIDVSRFRLIYVYPFPSITRRLSLKLLNECRRGARIIVHDYPLEGVSPLKSTSIPSGRQHVHKIFLYIL